MISPIQPPICMQCEHIITGESGCQRFCGANTTKRYDHIEGKEIVEYLSCYDLRCNFNGDCKKFEKGVTI